MWNIIVKVSRFLLPLLGFALVESCAQDMYGCPYADWLKSGSIVVDISTNWRNDQLTGDADESALAQRGISFSPVPGGVGPVTLAVLLENMVLSKERNL